MITINMSVAETVEMFENPELAIRWALEHLEPHEGYSFLKARKEGEDLMPFIEAYRQDLEFASDVAR